MTQHTSANSYINVQTLIHTQAHTPAHQHSSPSL